MVFVTGATGLVGRYLVDELLRRGKKVRALCRPQSDRKAVHAFLEKLDTGSTVVILKKVGVASPRFRRFEDKTLLSCKISSTSP